MHDKKVEKYDGDSDLELPNDLRNLRYDVLEQILQNLSLYIYQDSINDLAKGRKQLAYRLFHASRKLLKASKIIKAAWKICSPYMKVGME